MTESGDAEPTNKRHTRDSDEALSLETMWLEEALSQAASTETIATVVRTRSELNSAGDISRFATFDGLPDEVLRLLRNCCRSVSFADGEFLLREGEPGDSLIAVQTGVVEILCGQGGAQHLLATIGAGHVIGEMSLLTNEPRAASARASSSVTALVLSATDYHRLVDECPELAEVMTHLIATRLGTGRHDALAGKIFHGFRIHQRLGRGGMAVIYHATDTATNGEVALKMMSHRLVYDAEAAARFDQEADLISRFDHPHIVKMRGRFSAFHTCFIVLEYVRGETLDDFIRRKGTVPVDECRRILGQIASGLHYAHSAGIIHRDIKPANIMLTESGDAKLMDFGLATPLNVADIGAIVGTPQYMAPEHLAGVPVSETADYFGLGCVAYEMLMGKRLVPEKRIDEIQKRHHDWQPIHFAEQTGRPKNELTERFAESLHPDPTMRRLDLERIASWSES